MSNYYDPLLQVNAEQAALLRVRRGGVVVTPDGTLVAAISSEVGAETLLHIVEQTGRLRGLSWTDSKIDGELFSKILASSPGLRWIVLDESKLDRRCLESLRECKELRELSMVDCSLQQKPTSLRDADFNGFQSAETLEVLDLRKTEVEGKFLDSYRSLRTLRVGHKIGVEGVEAISRLEGLKELRIGVQMSDWDTFRKIGQLRRLESLSIYWLPKIHGTLDPREVIDEYLCDILPQLKNLKRLKGGRYAPLLTDESARQLPFLAKLESVEDRGSSITDRGLQSIAGCARLRRLHLHWGELYSPPKPIQFTPKGLAALAKAKMLSELSLLDADLSDDYCRAISRISSLRKLEIGAKHVTTDGARFFANLPQLESLALHNLNWVAIDTELSLPVEQLELGDSEQLTELDLSKSYLAGPFFDRLRELPNLKRLDLTAATLDDEAWASLAKLPQVETLVLPGQWTGDKALFVQKMPSLRVVYFGRHASINDEEWALLNESKSLQIVVAGNLQTSRRHGLVPGPTTLIFVPESSIR